MIIINLTTINNFAIITLKKEGVVMSKKNKQVHTQKQMLNSVMNNPVLFEDADICKKLLVAYLHDQTDGMDDKTKYKFAQEIIFPLRKLIYLSN